MPTIVKVVPLSPQEEARMIELSEMQRAVEERLRSARGEVTQAIRKRNAIAKQEKKLTAEWLALAEKKYPENKR
jgi:hypothetical protein